MARSRPELADDEPPGAGLARRVVAVLPLLLILGGVAAGSLVLWRDALKDKRYLLGGDTLTLSGVRNAPAEALTEIERLGRFCAGRSLLDPFLLTRLRREYSASPWIRRVCSLRRVPPNRVAVEFVPRLPSAQARHEGYYWLVDSEGILLPVPGNRKPFPGLPEVAGALGRRPRDGQRWRDEGMADALGVLSVIANSPLTDSFVVTRINVARGALASGNRPGRPRLNLETAEGVTIRWGTYNRGDLSDEILNSEKIAMLRQLIAREYAAVPGVILDVATRVPGYGLPEPVVGGLQ